MKACSACEVVKALGEFQRRAASPDGLTAACRTCLAARDRARYPGEREARRALHDAYMQTPAGKAAHARATYRWKHANPVQRAAHVALGNAVRDGRVFKWPACAVPECEYTRVEGHHPDYDQPFEVVWLCAGHHDECHLLAES